jgi:BRCT domain type II-containing protein
MLLPLSGQIVCIAGTLARPRAGVYLRIALRGGRATRTAARATLLVRADRAAPWRTLARARRLGIRVISEGELDAILSRGEPIDLPLIERAREASAVRAAILAAEEGPR